MLQHILIIWLLVIVGCVSLGERYIFCMERGLLVGGDGDMYLGRVLGDVVVVAGED